MIRIEELRKAYGSNVAVDGVSLEIGTGETLGLLGPNGAGKTTTISMMVGLLKPDSGKVAVGADDKANGSLDWNAFNPMRPVVRKSVGVAPQTLSLYDEMSAKENLDFFGGLYGLGGSKLKERVNWALEFSGLTDRKGDRVETFSGGMKRRLNIAAALIHSPKVLLLDEPTVGVDPQSRNHIFESIQSLQKEGLTIIYTTHYMEEAQRLCDRVAIIDHGKLLDVDTVNGLIQKHGGQSVVTAELAQDTNVNLPGTLDGRDLRFQSENPIDEIAKLTNEGVKFQTVQINQPDLESVFLKLTGRSLRD